MLFCSFLTLQAKEVEDNGGVYFVPAFSGLFAPYWREDARGTIVGMTMYSNQNHICRAVLEAVAYQVRRVASFVLCAFLLLSYLSSSLSLPPLPPPSPPPPSFFLPRTGGRTPAGPLWA